jgi:tetratricopeptide (TPR) repeat protein
MENAAVVGTPVVGREFLTADLLDRGLQDLAAGDLSAAQVSVTAAIPLDPTPAARYVYAQLLCEAGKLEPAIQQLELAWEQARRMSSPIWRSRCCHALAELHRMAGHHDLVNRFRQWAIRAELDAEDDISTAEWLYDRAAEALAAERLDDAEAYLNCSARVSGERSQAQSQVQIGLGIVCARRGRWSQAIRWFVRAFQSLRRMGDARGCAEVVLRVGSILQQQGDWQRAETCFRRAARTLHRLRNDADATRAERYASECSRMLFAMTGDPRRN